MRAGWLLLLVLAACARTDLPSVYQDARRLLLSERYPQASAQVDLGLRHAPPGSNWEGKFRLLKAAILLGQNEAQQAQDTLQRFSFPPGSPASEDQARYRLYQARVAFYLGNLPETEARLRQAQSLARSVHADALLAESKLLECALYAQAGKFADAEAASRDALDYAVRHGDASLQMKASGNMGYMLLRQSRYEEALPWFDKVLSASHGLGAALSEAKAIGNVGWCHYRLGDFDQALDSSQQAAAACERLHERSDWQRWLGNIGDIYLDQRDYTAAAKYYKEALAVAQSLHEAPSIADLANNLAMVSIATHDWDSAERYNHAAKSYRQTLYSLNSDARIAAGRNQYERAEQLFRSVIHSSGSDQPDPDAPSNAPTPLLDAHAGLARMWAGMHRDGDAEAEFRAALTIVEHQQAQPFDDKYKMTYRDSTLHFYQDYVEFLMSRARPRDALEVAESIRARVLADKLNLASNHRTHTAADFQKLAGTYKSTILSYWIAPEQSYMWAITPAAISAFPLPPEADLKDWVKAYDALIQNSRDPLQVENPAGRKLYAALIAPARPFLAKTGRVIVVPNGPLYALNFETLPVFDAKPHYWIEDATVSVTPALTLLSSGSGRPAAAHSLLLIGNPVSAGARYPALEFAGQEMAAIQQSLPGFRTVALGGAQAQPDAYTAADPGRFALIHFVAHASADRVDPLQSAVILSPHGLSYALRAADVMKTPLRADLVTVSACRSAGARTYGGEGLVGFSWAFLEAGAHNVIAGLWDVNDRSTADLMAGLYRGLARGAPPADALRSAKLELVRSSGAYRKPYYWGPFQVFTRSR